ncbi:16S rRNA (guanine(527)-N(7))-methyltransferase RsmG [bacterium]|nr:16S rRNA (guanine(527)-N(7))-methyltransferase RsmG [bacterium]
MNSDRQIRYYLQRIRDAKLSLVSRLDKGRLEERHLQPSLEALDLLPDSGQLLDVGSGGGFPGIPIAIHKPDLSVTLVESNTRKASFLMRVSRETELNNLKVLNLRVESLDETHTGQYDIITARAVTDLVELIEWTERLLQPDGKWLLWKSRNWRNEADPADYGLKVTAERPLGDGGVLLELVRSQ